MRQVTVTGQIVSKNGITLFLADGSSEVLSSESYRTKEILEKIMPDMIAKGTADVDLERYFGVLQNLGVSVEQHINGGATITTDAGQLVDKDNALEKHLLHAEETGDAVGLKAFLADLAPVIEKRRHSVEDLLTFMKKADLPIADDGSIVVYKVLNRIGSGEDERFTDCHTGRVTQRVGSVVQVKDESMVDPNRNANCSRGLHVCQVGYIGGFTGSVICFAKVRPSDIIAVPAYDTTKMRASRYHLVAEIPVSEHPHLRGKISATDRPSLHSLLAKVLSGDHAPIIEHVTIGGDMGQDVTIEPVVTETSAPPIPVRKKAAKKAAKKAVKARKLDKFGKTAKRTEDGKVETQQMIDQIITSRRRAKLTPKEIKERDYQKKLDRARKLYKDGAGLSIRAIALKLGMDRNALAKNLA